MMPEDQSSATMLAYLLVLVCGGLGGLIAGFLLGRRDRTGDTKGEMRDLFEALAHQSLKDNADLFLNRTAQKLEPLEKSLDKLDGYIRDLEQKREGAYSSLAQQLQQVAQTQNELQQTTTTLSQALRSSSVRGRWGELQLRRVVELSGLVRHVDFEEQLAAGDMRPDMTVHLPNGAVIPVDAKVPMNAYLEAVEAGDEATRRGHLAAHSRAMRARIRELAQKRYWDQFDPNPQFVIMYVPNEACLHAAFDQDGDLFEYALQSQVVVASPVTLLALLKAVAYGWQQVSLAENARAIAAEGRELYGRLGKTVGYINDLGTQLGRSMDAFNGLVGSFQRRLLPAARRFQELGVDASEIPAVPTVESAVRRLSASELDQS
jgi:DNA recombination protein RmuC